MKKMLFFINPASGKRALEDDLMRVVSTFASADYEVNIYISKSKEDMIKKLICDGGNYDMITCCGGDGTLNIVGSTIYKNNIDAILGYIPGGTTNDFANTHQIDTTVTEAAKQIVTGKVNDVDLGLMNGEPFVYVAAFGMFSELSYLTSREMKENLGYAAYLSGGIKSLLNTKPYHLVIEHDHETIEGDYVFCMVSNSRRVGGLDVPIIKNVEFDDGEMEVTLIRQSKNPADNQKLINSLITAIADEDMVKIFKTSKLRITSEQEIPWSLDGEFGGSYKESNVEVKKAAIKMAF